MKIKSIQLKHTNPSLGSHEKTTIVSLSITEEHLKRVNDFLHQSKVNDIVSLYKYLEAKKSKNQEVINRVLENAPNEELRSGENISHLSFYFEDEKVIELADVYRRFKLTHFYNDFTRYMVENGTIEESKSDGFTLL